MSQITMFGLSIALGAVFAVLLKLISMTFVKFKFNKLTIITIDIFSYGICLIIAGLLMQIYNHKVAFYLYCGVVFGFLLVLVFINNVFKKVNNHSMPQIEQKEEDE